MAGNGQQGQCKHKGHNGNGGFKVGQVGGMGRGRG
jgi:hypothetical protein